MNLGKQLIRLLASGLILLGSHAQAQLKSLDVGGFQIGQTVSEAEQTIRSRYPQFKTEKVYFPGPNGKASANVALMLTGVTNFPQESITSNGRRPDAFSLAFSRVDGKLMHITRYMDNPSGVVGEELRTALIGKYGPEDVFEVKPFAAPSPGSPAPPKPATYRRAATESGANANAPACEAQFPPAWGQRAERQAMSSCGAAIRAFWSNPVAPGVFRSYEVTLFDHARNRADFEAGQNAARAARDAATQRATGNASKPSL